jgi:hypothetical protein
MYYIIANSPDQVMFQNDIDIFRSKFVPFTTNYIVSTGEPLAPGGWGCVRFTFPEPSGKIFNSPNVEYRYSADQDAWQVDGETSPLSNFVKGLHDYFVSLEGQSE